MTGSGPAAVGSKWKECMYEEVTTLTKGGGPTSPIEPAHYCRRDGRRSRRSESKIKDSFPRTGKESLPTNTNANNKGAANSFPVARGSNRNANQAGLLAPAFPSPAPSHALAQWHCRIAGCYSGGTAPDSNRLPY